jgi:hypothetical protein
MSDYLWQPHADGDGDPEIERFEQLLSPYAYRGAPPELPRKPRRRTPFIVAGALLVAAAMLVAVLWPRGPSWMLTSNGGESRLRVGEWLDAKVPSTLRVADIGSLRIERGTKLRIVESRPGAQRIELDHGEISAEISAPARVFSVHTPWIEVVDLGCAFQLSVSQSGLGHLTVSSGKVSLGGVEVAAGSECDFNETGPAVPYLSDAGPAVRGAANGKQLDAANLEAVFREARLQDAPTLRAVISRIPAKERTQAEQRLGELEHPPAAKPKAEPKAELVALPKPKAELKPTKHPTKPRPTYQPAPLPPKATPVIPTPPERDTLKHDTREKLEGSAP